MLEKSFGLTFFLKTPKKRGNIRYVYLRITVDGVPKETSTRRKWDATRWDQDKERAVGNKEDARELNSFLESIETKIKVYRTGLINKDITITSQLLMDYVMGNNVPSKKKVLEEFKNHNDEVDALVAKGEFAAGTHERYVELNLR